MTRKHRKRFYYHEHWFAEWWSAMLLIITGSYAFTMPNATILHRSFVDGFVRILPVYLWESLFILVGIIQLFSLLCESFVGRGMAAFFATTLFIWGFLNILVYSQQWHVSLIAWGVLAVLNLYALSRILTGMERQCYEHFRSY